MFYACFTLILSWEGRKNLRVGLQETNFFFRPEQVGVSNRRGLILDSSLRDVRKSCCIVNNGN